MKPQLFLPIALLAVIAIGCTSLDRTTNINSFEECVAAGNPVMESDPPQCRTEDGRTFTQQSTGDQARPEDQQSVPPAVEAARAHVETDAGATAVVTGVEEREWSDSCLGLGGPAESCLQVMTPGYEVEVIAGGKLYVVRADEAGSAIRVESVEATQVTD